MAISKEKFQVRFLELVQFSRTEKSKCKKKNDFGELSDSTCTILFPSSGKISAIIIAGGCGVSSAEILTGDLATKEIPNLPKEISYSSMILHDGKILMCGGWNNELKCLQFNNANWIQHSMLKKYRLRHSAATLKSASFVFGGLVSQETYEYLPKGSNTWLMGKTEIPGGFFDGFAIAVQSKQEIWLIGGTGTENRILCFNVNDHTFQELSSQLNVERPVYSCAFIPHTNKIMISGGHDSSEILDTVDGSVTMASPMNFGRQGYGMGVLTIDGEERLAVFGGDDGDRKHDSVELYNTQTEKWETSNMKLKIPRNDFGFLRVKLSDLISKPLSMKNNFR